MKEQVEYLKFLSSICGMIAAASFVASFFDKVGTMGAIIGLIATYVGTYLISLRIKLEKEHQQ